MNEPDAIIINGLEFYGYHGASDQEQTVGHRYVVHVRLTVDTRSAASTDLLSDTVSYSRVAKRIVEVGTQERFRLLESLAARLVSTVFEGSCPYLPLCFASRNMPSSNECDRCIGWRRDITAQNPPDRIMRMIVSFGGDHCTP